MVELGDYFVNHKVGNGGFGTVFQGFHKVTGEIVAIKILNQKFNSWEECMDVPEVYIVSRVMKHENIVQLKNVFWDWEYNNMCLVSEYMAGHDLYKSMAKRGQPFPEALVKKWCFQVLQGLAHIHSCGFIHRDIKPGNLLLSKDNNVKIADFGIAHNINSQSYASKGTLNYMAPEILLRSRNYGYAVDMWAMGATIAELLSFNVLFPGRNAYDQFAMICAVIGNLNVEEWEEGVELARILNYKFPEIIIGGDVRKFIPSASEDAIDVIKKLCCWDPKKRSSAVQILDHRFFKGETPSSHPNSSAHYYHGCINTMVHHDFIQGISQLSLS